MEPSNQLGFFSANKLNVVYNQVASSPAAFTSLFAGDYDILTATFDNSLNYRFNLNESVTVLGQLDQGPDLVIASVPSITNASQLQGKSLMVDSATSGYSYLLQYVLSTFGLTFADEDFGFQVVGGTATRYSYLIEGTLPNGSDVYATILAYPLTIQGEALPAGTAPNILARISDYIAPITSSSFMVRESTLSNKTQTDIVTRFVASMLAANRFLHEPLSANCSISAIAAQLGVSEDVAAQDYASATNLVSGEVSLGGNFTINLEGALNDVRVREIFDGFSGLPAGFDFAGALQPGEGQLVDYLVRDAAVRLYEENRAAWSGNCSRSLSSIRNQT
ncbi:hypothetical protein N0V82_009321 [Gnomoniopsis sp. IMI 355080]|nr:hypothetical protein N0V82_009321 [Gnomoniopsis sp. IMI 355080]